jgi:hypothetical protein
MDEVLKEPPAERCACVGGQYPYRPLKTVSVGGRHIQRERPSFAQGMDFEQVSTREVVLRLSFSLLLRDTVLPLRGG